MVDKSTISVKHIVDALGQMMKERVLESAKRTHSSHETKNFRPNGSEKKKLRQTNMKKRFNEAKEHWINIQCEEIEANTGVIAKRYTKR